MSKIRIYSTPGEITGTIKIEKTEVIHKIKDVLRLKEGHEVYVFDGAGKEYSCTLSEVQSDYICLQDCKLVRKSDLPAVEITLGFPLVKEDKIDFILQKATELGVSHFSPFICERSIKNRPQTAKLERWRKIIIEAARQSERLWLAQINDVCGFSELCGVDFEYKLAALPQGSDIRKLAFTGAKRILVIVGPEGDLSERECEDLKKNNFKFIKLSDNILRVETAAIFAVGLLHYYLNN